MLWPIDSCQNRVSADQYHLTVSRAQVSTHPGRVFFEVIRWQVTSSQNPPSYLNIQAGKTFSYHVTNWSRSKSNFYALIGQNSTGEFMPIIYEVSWNVFTLTAEADRVLCQLVMFFSVFSPRCTKCNTAAIKRLLFFMAGLFIGFLVEKCVAFGWHRFLFLPFLMR